MPGVGHLPASHGGAQWSTILRGEGAAHRIGTGLREDPRREIPSPPRAAKRDSNRWLGCSKSVVFEQSNRTGNQMKFLGLKVTDQ